MPSTYDTEQAIENRDSAIDQVEKNASARWKKAALDAVSWVAANNEEFIVDAVWQRLGTLPEPSEPRAMGAVMRRAVKQGLIKGTDRYLPSSRTTAHRNPRRIWRSLLRVKGPVKGPF
jgi:hypothetical protein